MAVLQRSKSEAVKTQNSNGRKDGTVAERDDPLPTHGEHNKMLLQERPKTADAARRSFSRPRPTNKVADIPLFSQTIEIKAGDEIFNFPTPSPRILAPKSATFPKPQPLSNLKHSPAIGVALGSPSQVAMPSWGRSFTSDHVSQRMPPQPPPAPLPASTTAIPELQMPEAPPTDLRRKKSAWKTFGSIFGRKPAKPVVQEPFYKLQLPQEQQRPAIPRSPAPKALGSHPPNSSPLIGKSPGPHKRTPSMTRGMARFEARAQADLASFSGESTPVRMRSPSAIQNMGFSPMFKAIKQSVDLSVSGGEQRNDSPLSMTEESGGSPRTPKLDLDLPDPQFERYSIMFEKLLTLEETKPSLLERRQSKMQRQRSLKVLNTVVDASEQDDVFSSGGKATLQRSATSPGLFKSLSIRIGKKVHSPTVAPQSSRYDPATAIHRPRMIERSKTVPPKALAPVMQNLSQPVIAINGSSPVPQIAKERSLPPTPLTSTTFESASESVVMAHDEPTGVDKTEPSPRTTVSQLAKTPTEERQDPCPHVRSPQELENKIVQVSVARQVSVSKARHRVSQAVDSKQPLRPRVVELSKNRKSTLVLIESGEE